MPIREMKPAKRAVVEKYMGKEKFAEHETLIDHAARLTRLADEGAGKAPGSPEATALETERTSFTETVNEQIKRGGYTGEPFTKEELFSKDSVNRTGPKWNQLNKISSDLHETQGKMVTDIVNKNGESVAKVREKGAIDSESAPKTTAEVADKIKDKSHLVTFLKMAGLIIGGALTLEALAKAMTGCYRIDLSGDSSTVKVCDKEEYRELCSCDHAKSALHDLADSCQQAPVYNCWDNAEDEGTPSKKHYNYIYRNKSIGDVIQDVASFVADAAGMLPQGLAKVWKAVIVAACVVGAVLVVYAGYRMYAATRAKKTFAGVIEQNAHSSF